MPPNLNYAIIKFNQILMPNLEATKLESYKIWTDLHQVSVKTWNINPLLNFPLKKCLPLHRNFSNLNNEI